MSPAGCLGSLAKCLSSTPTAPTAPNCNELHILRSAQKPLLYRHQTAVTQVLCETRQPAQDWASEQGLAPIGMFSTPWGANSKKHSHNQWRWLLFH